jgi:hypothetical protein
MLCGDFNARTASDHDFIQYDNNDKFIQNDSNYIYDLVNFCRISTDVTTCNRGKRLLEICPEKIEWICHSKYISTVWRYNFYSHDSEFL